MIIPNYNHIKYLGNRLDSVLNQDYKRFEVILLDDASEDGSKDLLIEFGRKHNWPVILNSENSGSPFKQWAKGVSEAIGEYVWIAESDDYCETNLLSTLVRILESDKSITLAYCQSAYVDHDSNELGLAKSWTDSLDKTRWAHDFVADGKRESFEWLSCRNTIPNASAVVFRRSAWPKIDDILDMRLCGDWMVWGRIARQGKVAFSANPMNYFRVHSNTVRSTTKKTLQRNEGFRAVKENLESSGGMRLTKRQVSRIVHSWLGTVNFDVKYLAKYALMLSRHSNIGAFLLMFQVLLSFSKGGVRKILRPIASPFLHR